MECRDFIIKELNELSKRFDNINTVEYGYNKINKLHIVKVTPENVFKNDVDYINWEIDFESRLIKTFEGEDILFISENSLTTLKNSNTIMIIK